MMMGPAERIRALQADRNNQQIEAKRQTVIGILVAIEKPFLDALEAYATTRHKNKSFELTAEETAALKVRAIKQLERYRLSIKPEIWESINLENLCKVSAENDRRLAYLMAHAVLADYEKKVRSYPIGYETNSETLVDIAKTYLGLLKNLCIEHPTFNSGRSNELKNVLLGSIRDTPFPNIAAYVKKAMSEMYTLLEAPAGRFDPFTLLRAAISSQYQFELAKFMRVHSREKRITALPAAVIDFIDSQPFRSPEIIIDCLAHAICKDPDLATKYELTAEHLEMQVKQAEERNAVPAPAASPTAARAFGASEQSGGSAGAASGMDNTRAQTPTAATAMRAVIGAATPDGATPKSVYSPQGTGRGLMSPSGRAAAQAVRPEHFPSEAAGGAGREESQSAGPGQ
ncbi:MAG: hypothetical protein K0R66_449 [Gammaproteobacteria bacterium]|jgi:hypothetical protein|nr:hypothetical protein [Gammaproteobacteria bacterium]